MLYRMKGDKSLLFFSHSAAASVSLGATARYHQHTHTLETLAYNQLEWSNKGEEQRVPRKYQ